MRRCPTCGSDIAPDAARCARCGSLTGDPHDPLVGAVLAGRYRVVSRIARGGMSAVYLARHVLIDRVSAIKVLRRDLCDDPVQRDRFLREARAVNRINHENIVEIIDYGESEDGRVFLVMEYLPGESLQQRVAKGPIPPAQALDIAIQIASGLARAHQMGVVHRDLKPDNVVLVPTPTGRELVKVLDFGIAKMLDQPALTATDKIFGTPGYIAPEYAAGAPVDARADLYSLGVVLYEMVTGALPFDVEFPADLLLKHMLEPPVPPRERLPSLPVEVERLVLQSLAKDPAQRYRDAHHMIEDLQRVRDALTSGGARTGTARVSERPPQDTVESPLPATSSLVPPPPDVGTSVKGARAWTRFLDALRAELGRRGDAAYKAAGARLAEMDRLRGAMVEHASRLDKLRGRMLALEARGRDFRATIGRAIDSLASDLSAKARERDAIAAERDALEARREALGARGRTGDADAAGEADALLWQIAACDEVLRAAVAECEDVEFQLRELSDQLTRLSEALEADQNELVGEIDQVASTLGEHDARLRVLAAELVGR